MVLHPELWVLRGGVTNLLSNICLSFYCKNDRVEAMFASASPLPAAET